MEEEVVSILELFEGIGKKVKMILKTERGGEVVENGYGVEFALPTYAVIFEGEFLDDMEKNKRIFEWEKKTGINLYKFNEDGCVSSMEALAEEMREMDGYEIVWRENQFTKLK